MRLNRREFMALAGAVGVAAAVPFEAVAEGLKPLPVSYRPMALHVLVEIETSDGTVYLVNDVEDLVHDGKTYTAVPFDFTMVSGHGEAPLHRLRVPSPPDALIMSKLFYTTTILSSRVLIVDEAHQVYTVANDVLTGVDWTWEI